MRKIAFALFVVLVTAVAGYAQNCTMTTLNNYLGSGFQCTINDQTYSSFTYSDTSSPAGFGIGPGSVEVIPITTTNNTGFQFTGPWGVSTSGGILAQDSEFAWTVNSTGLITDLSLSIAGVGFTGTGAINLDETACLGAILPACSGGTTVTLSVFDSSAGNQLYDQVNFAGVHEVSVEKDLLVSAGTNGSAEVSVITDQFSESSTVPEPGTLSMMGLGVVALAGFVRRKLNM
ncbi:MAG: PEP-CTERM sorting domain-containing protein [Candidatus Korobacteraceae bacterium]|jgi:PEP-CTERM motif-containing protein